MFILKKKKKKRKKIIVLGSEKKIPLTWLTEHMLLVAVVLSQHAARVGMLHREVINLILFVMISSTCRSGSQAQAATLWQENKVRDDTRSGPKEEVKSHNRQEMWVLVLCCSFFPSVKWGQHLSYRKKLEEHVVPECCLCGCWRSSEPGSASPQPQGHSSVHLTACISPAVARFCCYCYCLEGSSFFSPVSHPSPPLRANTSPASQDADP